MQEHLAHRYDKTSFEQTSSSEYNVDEKNEKLNNAVYPDTLSEVM